MPSFSRKLRRLKPGTGFLLIRLIGWCFKIVGGLLIAAAFVGFIATLVKAGPTLFGAFEFIEQKMAGLVIIGIFVWLAVFVLLGFGGIVFAGIGFALGRWGTEPASVGSISVPMAQSQEQRSSTSD